MARNASHETLPGQLDFSIMPGWKEGATSREAAEAFAVRAGTLRWHVLDYVRGHSGRTADEIALALGETVLAIRPRVSELRRLGLIVNCGRGKNRSGHGAHRWRAV